MASIARGRSSRRVASRRTSYIEEVSEEEDPGNVTPTPSYSNIDEEEDENDNTPVAKKPIPRRGGRRKASEAPAQPPKRATRVGRRAKTAEPTPQPEEEPSVVAETVEAEEDKDESTIIAQEEPGSPSEQARAAQKRKRAGSSRKSRDSVTPAAELSSLPTPSPSASPEASSRSHREFSSPLSDITQTANNKSPAPTKIDAEEQKSQISIINPMSTNLEKPMDIVLKSRSLGVPVVEEPKVPRARMVITHLVLTNFKSYAGKQVVGPFHVSFSSVVGPNGSGKSNVIDSLLFVFGFRASKMRQGKVSALIHNSARFPDLSFCEVEVHFQEIMDLPGGAHKVIPDSQLVVSRRAFKNNSSKYYMDKKETNFTTVTTFLKDRGIDLDHKRFLILQGEVESIAQMKPKAANEHEDGLLEYLEDIIGTSKYKTPIDEAATEVETLNDVCVEKNNRVQHVEKEKTALEDKKNKALAYIRDENDLMIKQSALYQIYIAECDNNTKVTEEAIMQMQELLNMELEKHEGNESGIKEIEKIYKRASKEYEGMEKSTQAMVKEMAKYDKETVKFEEKRKFLAGKQKKLEKTLQTSRLASSECASLVDKHSYDIEKKSAEISQLENEMKLEEDELASIRESLKGKTQGLSDQIAAKQKSLEPWNAKINEKLSAIAVAQSELDILNERGNAGAKALEEAQARITSIEESLADKEADLEEKHQEKTQLESEVESLKRDINKLSSKEPELRSYVSNARQKAEEARASLVSTQNKGSVLSGLMRLKESGRIDGFHGRLGNLGTIEEKYDVAISTACPQLENMVVDTVEAGQQCIDYLRKNNLGRANFILLDRLPKRDMSTIYTPESVPRLFDLVKPKEPEFAPAFYSVLQNTLVAKDLEQANRIAYGAKRWRVVTLDGQLIDLSGTMSGGGTRVAKGGMSSKQVAETSKEQVSKLEYDRDELEKKLQLFQDKQRQLETSLRQKSEEIPKLDTKIQKIGIEIESGKRSLADAQRRIKELSVEHKPSKTDENRTKALEQQMNTLQEEVENLRQDMAGIEEEIQSLQAKIMEVGGIRLRSQKAKVDGLKEQINLLSEEISNAEVAKTKNEKLIKKHEKSLSESQKESEQLDADIEQLNEDVKNQANDASGSRQRAEEAQEVSKPSFPKRIIC
jgi:structural maintenance of chromosome 4